MKKIIILVLALFVMSSSFAQFTNEQIIAFAQKNYMNLLGTIPEKNLGEYGLKSREDLNNIKVSAVFTEYSYTNKILQPTQNYRLLILNSQNEPCGLLTVFNSNNSLSVVDYGALGLSKELLLQTEKIKSKSLAIYRDYANQCDYLFDNGVKQEAAIYYKLFTKKTFKFSEILK